MTGITTKSVLLIVCLAGVAAAQEFRATITGQVTDQTGGAVPNVAVQVKNVETNEIAASATNAQGIYTVPFLRPGSYAITVETPGFKKAVREGLTLNVGQTATVNLTLEVGQVSDQVTVTAETPLLETAKADRGQVIDEQRVREFPLNARNPFMLALLSPGVNFNGNIIYQRPFDNGAIADWNINGGLNRNNEFLLDGAPNNSKAGENNIAYVPPVDSVQEFKIQTNSYDAQFGKSSGGSVNVSLKSGTNALHGTVYEFARRHGWDANSFQNNAKGVPVVEHFLDQYGGAVGGPIYIPKLYNGKDKSFFFFNYEGYREGTPTPLTLSVPAPEFLNGDFSKLTDAQGRRITIYDPSTGRDVNGVWTRDAFPNNQIPAGRINPIAQKIVGYQPKPNTTTPGQGYSRQNFFIAGGENLDRDDFYNLVIKFDQNMGDRHRMFFRHASNDRTEMRSTNGLHGVAEDGPLPLKRVNDAYVLDWVGTLQPTTILNARLSYNRYLDPSYGRGNQGFDLTSLGFPKWLVDQLPGVPSFGRYEFTDYTTLGRYYGGTWTNTWALHPTLTKVHNTHSIKAGFDMRWTQYANKSVGNPFRLTSNRTFTQRDYNRGDALSGDSFASFLLGTPSGGNIDYNAFTALMWKYYAPYIQDDWKVSRKMTLNLGLRWDVNVPPNERYNRLNRGFDFNVVNPVDKMIDRAQFPNFPAVKGGLLFAGIGGLSRSAADTDFTAFQPRFGMAYQVSSKLVLRGGFGRYYLNPNNDYGQAAGFSQSTPLIASLDGNRTPIQNAINNPFPNGILFPPGSSLGLLTQLGRGPDILNPDFRLPYVHQFSFGFQYELPLRSRVEASYVGSRGYKLEADRFANEPSLDFRKGCNLMEGGNPLFCDQRVPNPFYNLAPFAGTNLGADPTLSRFDLARPYPEFGSLRERTRNDGKTWYNSMQAAYEMRATAGLNLSVAYTLSKMMEQAGYQTGGSTNQGFNDVQNFVVQRGLHSFDRPHVFKIGSVWEMPFGKGRRFFSSASGIWGRVASGWQHTMILQYSSGRPWELPRNRDNSANNVLYVKEAKIDNVDWSAGKIYGVRPCVGKWNDNGSITMQAYSVSYGCTDYNFLILPRYAPYMSPRRDGRLRLHAAPQADMSVSKNTPITERMSVQFRAEAFNIFNTFYFPLEQFNNNVDDANFGSIIKSTVAQGNANFPRQIQFAVKFIF